MNARAAAKHYFDLAESADTPTWRTVYTLGLMCAVAVTYGDIVTFVGHTGYGGDWPDPRLARSADHLRRRDD